MRVRWQNESEPILCAWQSRYRQYKNKRRIIYKEAQQKYFGESLSSYNKSIALKIIANN